MLRKYMLVILAIMFADCNVGSQPNAPVRLHLFTSSNLTGYLEPCG